jgi:hypothetical protein
MVRKQGEMARTERPLVSPQPAVGIATGALALIALILAWREAGLAGVDVATLIAAIGLSGSVVVAYQHPVHLRTNIKVCMSEVPYYLLTVLVSPALAASVAGVAALIGEWTVREERGSRLFDRVTEAGRRMLLIYVASVMAHLGEKDAALALALIGAACLLGVGDIATFPLVLARLGERHPWRIIPLVARDASWTEGIQYVLGLLGAYAALHALWTLLLLTVPAYLIYRSAKNAKEMHDETRTFLEDLADTVDLRDPYTGGHSRRVTAYCAGMLRALRFTGPEVTLILSAARVHDIGKIAIPDGVLNKQGPLTPEEWALMKTHPDRGADFLQRYRDFAHGVEIVRRHHESWDGTGYPGGLTGTEIPFGARVIAVADSFDAMTSDRPYRKGMAPERAAAILREGRGRQWESALVDAFLESVADQLAAAIEIVPVPERAEPAPGESLPLPNVGVA